MAKKSGLDGKVKKNVKAGLDGKVIPQAQNFPAQREPAFPQREPAAVVQDVKHTRVEIWGIKFDALVDMSTELTSKVPEYVTEKGFVVSDNIVNDPEKITMTLVVSDMPLTYGDGYVGRCVEIEDKIRDAWAKKEITNIITKDRVYKDMVIEDFTIKKSKGLGNSREISVTAKKVRITKKKTAKVPKYVKKKGTTKKKNGKARTSKTPANSNAASPSTTTKNSSSSSKKNNSNKGAATKKNQTAAKQLASALLGKKNYNKYVKGKKG